MQDGHPAHFLPGGQKITYRISIHPDHRMVGLIYISIHFEIISSRISFAIAIKQNIAGWSSW